MLRWNQESDVAITLPGDNATQAGLAYRLPRKRCVHDHLVYWCWSPQQIAARLRAMHPDDPSQHVSHETIYAAIYIYARGSLKPAMIEALRQEKPPFGRQRTTLAGGSFVPEELRIQHRPKEIEQRPLPGHWEGDFIKGAFNRSAVVTLVERTTRFAILCRMDGCTAKEAPDGITRPMKKLPAFLHESLTYDRGTDMACHIELSKRLNIDIWFADPHSPWRRGSNENTNGLLTQFQYIQDKFPMVGAYTSCPVFTFFAADWKDTCRVDDCLQRLGNNRMKSI